MYFKVQKSVVFAIKGLFYIDDENDIKLILNSMRGHKDSKSMVQGSIVRTAVSKCAKSYHFLH